MTTQTESSRFIVSSRSALYQRLLSGGASHQELGIRVLRQIKTAQAFRQVDQVRELARLLINNPIREFHLIGQYYLVWCKCRESDYQTTVLERIAEQTETYKARALSSRGTIEWYKGNNEAALYFYVEALKASPTISEYIDLSKAIAVLKSQEGFHKSAVKDLEATLRIIRYAEPLVYYEFLNSYAVELANVGRITEAESASLRAVSSAFGPFYREWQETLWEVRSKRRRHYGAASPIIPKRTEVESPKELRIKTVVDYMNANLHRKLRLSELANLINISASHLSYFFKVETGISPGEYLIRLRMEKTSHLLKTSFLSVKEIMGMVGYDSRSNFSRHFRRYFDSSPLAYRKQAFRPL